MIEIEFSIWLATKTRWAHLTKVIAMPSVPRVGEVMKFTNKVVGDYFGFKVTEVVYRESGMIEVRTELLDNTDDRMFSFETEEEFDPYYSSYLAEGWTCDGGVRPNRHYSARVAARTGPGR